MDEHNTGTMLWRPYELTMVRAAGVSPEVELALADPGFPEDCHHMFVRDAALELQARDLPCGPAMCLGVFEDGVNSYWLAIHSGEVWMAYGYDGGPQRFALVNSSVGSLQRLLRLWDSFVRSGRSEDDEDYEDYVAKFMLQAQQQDPVAFGDEDCWWSRVLEEVELGALGPE
ncbi:SUKH-4 family immunity protein [Streptomyces sp. NPDC059378]|uniref:SUKH-4 family immunity protein n=1 Tax=Streptomyces sp. NPDC059378 TaxID=3346815 RepID=UPI00367E4DCD